MEVRGEGGEVEVSQLEGKVQVLEGRRRWAKR